MTCELSKGTIVFEFSNDIQRCKSIDVVVKDLRTSSSSPKIETKSSSSDPESGIS
jgi:hypothetical protein